MTFLIDRLGTRLYNFMKYKSRNKVIFDNDDYSEQTPKNLVIEKPIPTPGGKLSSALFTKGSKKLS